VTTSCTLELPCDTPPVGTGANTASQMISSLALLCARPRGDGSATGIPALAESKPDWAALLSAAADHGVAPLVCKRLEELAGDALPAIWRQRFRQEFARNARRNLFLAAELFRVLGALNRRGLQAIPFKGPVLAAQAYGDIALRQFADLDVVLPHSEIVEAHRTLESLSFRSENSGCAMPDGPVPGQYAYRNESRDALIELHTEKTMRYLPVPLDWNALASRFETVSVGGQQVRTFSREDTLMFLCVHGTKHFWSRLGWICDIAELVQAPQGVDWERSENLARRMRCRRMWLLGLALANKILQAPLPELVLQQIRSDPSVAALNRQVQAKCLNVEESNISVAQRLHFRVNSQDTFAAGLRQLSVVATRPTEQDWHSRALPRWAAPLYAVLRPWRIFRDYGLGLRRKPARGNASVGTPSRL
jgi:hypothetical protein